MGDVAEVLNALAPWAAPVGAWLGSRAGIAGLTRRVARLEVVVGLRKKLRAPDAAAPSPEDVAALVRDEEDGPK